ncbi:tight junction-associated protein 1 isoform X2 [Strongylocentrotus purpuratus]|uniref:Brain-enriched guanylate kinase-associated protein n=1 Tax=Strongylocentrotus purpuratus TaxID=7668 RepID=A0A7M7GGV5_STRPU|nr:tight junction-associated protein 1 isoform X2 [Strongylocentrotus purpuratus]
MGDMGGAPDHDKCHVCGCSKEQYYTLKQRVEESKQRINLMESEFLQSTLYTENELDECREEYRLLQQKYNALEKSHQELHEINQDLEERILDVAAAYEKEKQALNREVLTLSQKLLDTKFEINKLEEKNNRYKKDCDLAVQLLQCTPSGAYMQHKVSQLPQDLQYFVHQIMGEINKGVYQPSATSPTESSNHPLLGSSGTSISNGLIAARTYNSVPAHVVARAMQRREEEEKKEMEKLVPTTRKRKVGKDGVVLLHDKGTQTITRPTMNKKYSLLCVKCGMTMKDEEEPSAEPAVEKQKEKEEVVEKKPEQEKHLLVDVSIEEDTEPPPVNLLDLTDTPPPRVPYPKGPSNTSLLLDLLDGPTDDAPEAEKAAQEQTLVDLSDLVIGVPEEMSHPSVDSPLSNATSPQDAATPADSGIFDDVLATSSATTHTSDSAASSDIASLEPEADAAMNVSRRSTPSRRLGSEGDGSPQHKVNGGGASSPLASHYNSDSDSKSADGQHDDPSSPPPSPVRTPVDKPAPRHPKTSPPPPPTSMTPQTTSTSTAIVKPRINGQINAGGRPGKLANKDGPMKDKPRPIGSASANQAAPIGRSKASYMQTSV